MSRCRLHHALVAAIALSGCVQPDRTAPAASAPSAGSPTPALVASRPDGTPAPAPPPPEPAPPALEPAARPSCVIRSGRVQLARALPLRVSGSEPFLDVEEADATEVRIASPQSTVRVVLRDMEIVGHVRLDDVPVQLRDPALVDGWLRVKRGVLLRADETGFDVEVKPPWMVSPRRAPRIHAACHALEVATRRLERPIAPFESPAHLRPGAHALRATPGGPVIATVEVPGPARGVATPLVDVVQREQRGAQVRIRLSDRDADAEGWVSRAAIAPPSMFEALGPLGGDARPVATITLDRDAMLLARAADRTVVVGTAHPGTFACVRDEGARPGGDVELDVNPRRRTSGGQAKLFVRPVSGEGCVLTGATPGTRAPRGRNETDPPGRL